MEKHINYWIMPGLIMKGERIGNATTIDTVALTCAGYFKESINCIRSKSRKAELVRPRQIAIWILVVKYRIRLIDVAGYFNRDHTTIISSKNRCAGLIQYEKDYRKEVGDILGELGI